MLLRYALDVGTNSIGWAVYEIIRTPEEKSGQPTRLVDAGVRIYADGRNPKDGTSLAVMRRVPRGARRRRDRFLQRRTYLLALLVRHGLMPQDPIARKSLEALDPYALRLRALDEAISLSELGRALFHLNQRRGFKSNRKADRRKAETESKEDGKIASAADKLKRELREQNCRTVGEFLARRQAHSEVRKREAVRIRIKGKGANALYDFYPTRDLLDKELGAIWSSQRRFHGDALSDAVFAEIRSAILFQRPLKEPLVGRCTFNPDEPRLARSHPLSERRRLFEDVNKLRIRNQSAVETSPLTIEQRDQLVEKLETGDDLTVNQIKRLLKLDGDSVLNVEEGGGEKLLGDRLAKRMVGGKKAQGPFSSDWLNLATDRQSEIIERIEDAESDEDVAELIRWLMDVHGLGRDDAELAAGVVFPDGHGYLGITATCAILAELEKDVIPYSEAAARAGYHHSDFRPDSLLDRLPYYGEALPGMTGFGTGIPSDPPEKRYGKMTNPTVHIGLNQLRRIVNHLIDAYGRPSEVVIELARELKKSTKEKEMEQRLNRLNEQTNLRRRKELADIRVDANPLAVMKMRLWEELSPNPAERCCPFTGELISICRLFKDVEIEHILPYSRTLDDSPANKTVALRRANREKRGYSPAEAARAHPNTFDLIAMQGRAANFPPNKRWRFGEDAMDRFESVERNFLDRQLNDTKYLARVARSYLTLVCDASSVWVVTGQLTSLLRGKWGLNSILADENRKNRNDHRHHAIDACVIGVTDRGLLNRVGKAAGRNEREGVERVLSDLPVPYENFRDDIAARIRTIIVSHKPEHGSGGALHEDTAYGIVTDNADNRRRGDLNIGNVVTRKPIDALSANEIKRIRDPDIRCALEAVLADVGDTPKALQPALAQWGETHNVRRVRILKPEASIVPIKPRDGASPYKALVPGENHHMDIVEMPDGSWKGFAATVFDVNQPGYRPAWRDDHPSAKLVMRVHKGDLVEVDDGGLRVIKRVVQLEPSASRMRLVPHNEGGALQKRHDDPNDPLRWDLASISKLKRRHAKWCSFDEIGRPRGSRSLNGLA